MQKTFLWWWSVTVSITIKNMLEEKAVQVMAGKYQS
jgi:hypothetical protein